MNNNQAQAGRKRQKQGRRSGGGRGGNNRKRQRQDRSSSGANEQTSSPATANPNASGKYYGPPATINGVAQLLESGEAAPSSMPLLLRLLDVKPLPDNMALSEAKASDDERTCKVMLFTSALESATAQAAGGGGAAGATAEAGTGTNRPPNELPGDFASAYPTSHLVFVNGFYVSSERGYHGNAPSAPPATLFLTDVEVVHTVKGADERERRAGVSRRQNQANRSNQRKGKKQKKDSSSPPGNDAEKKTTGANTPTASPAASMVKGGMVGEFFSKYAPRLTDVELAGFASATARSPTRTIVNAATGGSLLDSFLENKQKVDEMLARHGAMQTLLSSKTSSSNGGSTSPTNQPNAGTRSRSQSNAADVAAAEIYLSALREFNTSQMDRQNAGLTSNVGRADAESAELIKKQHRAALQAALDHAENTKEPLSIKLLCQWHELLCGAGVHKEAGMLRKKSVRAGRKSFTKPEKVREELEKVIEGIGELEKRLVTNRPTGSNDGQGPLIFAAAALFGIVDVHPFADGNGRLSRIAANWCLRRAGFPFPINFLVTQSQRREYVSAVQLTNGATHLLYRSVKAEQDASVGASMARLDVLRTTGCFSPLVCLISDRLARAFSEFRREEVDKANLVSEETEARAARNARERAAESDCIICFSEKPNIATLCCGKAVHLNCIAEWLGSNESCPFCRSTIPKLETTRTKRPARAEDDDGNDHTTDEFDFTTTTEEDHDDASANSTREEEDVGEPSDDTTTVDDHDTTSSPDEDTQEDDTTTDVADDYQDAEQDHDTASTTSDHDTASAAEDNDTTTESASEQEDTTTTEVSSANDSSDTTTSVDGRPEARSNANASQQLRRCDCGNRNAIDCTNNACGRCCVLYGTYACSRHSV